MPAPRRGDYCIYIVVFGLPDKHCLSLFAGSYKLRGVARPAGCNLARYGLTYYLFRRIHYLPYGKAHAVSKVKHVVFAAVHKILSSQHMGRCEVAHMYVIPHACTVASTVIVAEYVHGLPLSVRHLQDYWYKVRFRVVSFAYIAVGVRPAGVEIAQSHKMYIVGHGGPVEHSLHGKLGFAVAVGRVGRVALHYWHALRLAIYGGCR